MENDVLDALEDLGYEGNLLDEGALVKAVQGDDLSFEFMSLCVWIVKELKKVCTLGETLTEVEDQETFKLEMSGLLSELCNPHPTLSGVKSLDSVHNRFLLLDYLTSELQACRMLGGVGDQKMEINQQAVSPTLQQIYLIFTALELPLPGKDATIFILFSQIENRIRQMLTRLPKNYLGEPLLKKKLSKNQWSNVEKINNQLNSEYSLRRQMLIKRLDVTVQSFGWSDKAKKNKDELAATFQPLRKSMSSMSTVTVADVLASRTDLLRQPRTSAGAIREKTKCPINRILMGNVPDRGGRPSTMKPPPPEMPSFKKRQEAPRGQRPQSGYGGRGGGGGGGGGRGRGRGRGDGGGREGGGRGHKVQGNWSGNPGGHGGGYGWSGSGGGQSGGYGWTGSGGGGQGSSGYGWSGSGGGYGYSGGGGQGGMHGWAGGGGRGSRGRDFWGMDNQGYNRNEYYS